MDTVHEDLKSRWVPTAEQVAEASVYMAEHGTDRAYTAHLLVNKQYGFWTTEVQVVPVEGVFADRDTASLALQPLVEAKGKETGLPVTGAYVSHSVYEGEDHWAVFEDILTRANHEW